MEQHFDALLFRWSAILMVAGSVLFWIGALTPPYKQWMTSDLREYLSIIHNNKLNWFLIHTPMLLGVVLTVIALHLFAGGQTSTGSLKLFTTVAVNGFAFGAVFLVINFAFRLTVTIWVAQRLADVGEPELWFSTWMDWSNLLFSVYMVLAYLSIGFLGLALGHLQGIPSWTAWFCLIFGFAGSIGYIVQIPLFAPPLMVHLPLMVAGVVMLLKLSLLK